MQLLREILEKLAKGTISIDDAEKYLKILAIDSISNVAKIAAIEA